MTLIGGILDALLIGIGYAIRYASAAAAFLLILRALFIKNVRNTPRWFGKPVYMVTSVLERPVRRMLPERVTAVPYDYTPIVAAILLMLLGLGAHEFIDIFTHELLLIHPAP